MYNCLNYYILRRMNKNLPIYLAEIMDVDEGIYTISLVDEPATQKNFVCFKEDKEYEQFSVQDEEQRIISGVVMSANTPIYRRDKNGFEYYLVFSPETIKLMSEKLFADNNQNHIDVLHNEQIVNGLHLVELFLKDSSKGIAPSYLEDVPEGSLIASYKVRNEEVWNKIKAGELRGFSLAGLFSIKREDSEEDELQEILSQLKKLRKIK